MRATSTTHPIRVDFVEDAPFTGRLGLTFAPGKKGGGIVSPVIWDRDLDRDLEDLVTRFRTDVLVSLMEPHEYEALGIPDLFARAGEKGIEVRALPIRDVAVPRSDQSETLDDLVAGVVRDLEEGRTVVVHCRGGRGRSGLVAACALTRVGFSAERAIASVRRYREGAVETERQAAYVAAYARSGSTVRT